MSFLFIPQFRRCNIGSNTEKEIGNGLIGAVFSGATFIYEIERIGFVIQSLIYFLITAAASMGITVVLWQLHRYPATFISTMAGYLATHIIMITIEYRKVKADIKAINEMAE